MGIDSKNLLVWVKAMSRGQALPLDASEIYNTKAEADNYASTSAIAYPGQTIKAKLEDGKYHSYTLQPSEAGYVLEEIGAVNESDLKQYVQIVDKLPETGQVEGVLYIVKVEGMDDGIPFRDIAGYIWNGVQWRCVFTDAENIEYNINDAFERIDGLEEAIPETYAPKVNPVFTGTVKVGTEEVAVKSYVDGLISNLSSKAPGVMTKASYGTLAEVKAGETFRVAEEGDYFEQWCEVGDLILILADGSSAEHGMTPEDMVWSEEYAMVIQANIDGAVTSIADTSTIGEIVVFDAVTGRVINGSGVQIASLNDAIAKAHEHSNKAKLDTYDKTQSELLAAAKTEAEGLVNTLSGTVDGKLANKADKATTLAGYGITDAYNKTEIDGQLKTITDNLNTKITASDVDTKIAEAKEDTLEEAAAAANQALNARVGSIPADTTIQSYIDTAVGSGGTASAQAIATAKQEAITASNNYTDTQLSAALTIVEF